MKERGGGSGDFIHTHFIAGNKMPIVQIKVFLWEWDTLSQQKREWGKRNFRFTFSVTNIPNSEVCMCAEIFHLINNNNGNDDINYAIYRFIKAFLPKTSSVLCT